MQIRIDPEIAEIVPTQPEVLESDEKKLTEGGQGVSRGYNSDDEWRKELRASIADSYAKNPTLEVNIVVWKGKGIIIDGIERWMICKDLGITPRLVEIELADKGEAVRERWRLNVQTTRRLSKFLCAERVYRYWEKYFRPERTAVAKANKGGRGKKAEQRVDQLKEMSRLARVSKATMTLVQRGLIYADNPKARMPKADIDETLRCMRNDTMPIGRGIDNFIGFDERAVRKDISRGKNVMANPVDWSKPGNKDVRKKWTGETNVVINADALKVLRDIPRGAVDRFVFSPPYYLCDASGDFFIDYGPEFKPFTSWDHYCNWTLRYLSEMWRILPLGGYIVANIDNTREPASIEKKDGKGKVVEKKKNPLRGKFYYHTDLIRAILRDIDVYSNMIDLFEESPSLNPIRFNLLDNHPLARQGEDLFTLIMDRNDGNYGYGPTPVDCGEYIWSKHQVVAKRSATGSRNAPQRRPNHEYVLFWRKGPAEKQASTMRPRDLTKGSISTWEEDETPDAFEQAIYDSYWRIPAAPDPERTHAAPFPPALAKRMIEQGGSVTDVICDSFCGRGTTLFMAAKRGRQYLGIELIPHNAVRSHREGILGQKSYQKDQQAKP